jgi:predicted TIM-barrel fold metal-dependent hydrolase
MMRSAGEPGAEAAALGGPVFTVPGTCDAHVHVFGPQDRFAYVPDRRYTPPDAPIEAYVRLMNDLGITRAVLTAPSIHGLDNRALLHGLAAGGGAFRGVVMVAPDVSDATLQAYHEAGVRGIRTQVKDGAGKPLEMADLRALARRIEPLGWHAEIHVDVAEVTGIDRLLAGFAIPVVIEHMGHMPTGRGLAAPGFQALLRFLRDGGWVKLSGSYINSAAPPPHDDVLPFVQALLEAVPERTVWGSNWPHPHQSVLPDDRSLAETIVSWVADPVALRDVLVVNPGRLYDFS